MTPCKRAAVSSDVSPFVGLARVSTMLADFNRLRRAIRKDHDIIAANDALDLCERWFDCIDPNAKEQDA